MNYHSIFLRTHTGLDAAKKRRRHFTFFFIPILFIILILDNHPRPLILDLSSLSSHPCPLILLILSTQPVVITSCCPLLYYPLASLKQSIFIISNVKITFFYKYHQQRKRRHFFYKLTFYLSDLFTLLRLHIETTFYHIVTYCATFYLVGHYVVLVCTCLYTFLVDSNPIKFFLLKLQSRR